MPSTTSVIDLKTKLSVQELGNVFRSTAESMYGIGGKIRGLFWARSLEFFTPQGDVFSAIDEDPCTFEVGVSIPTFGNADGGVVVLHMYVWDRQQSREVRLASSHALLVGAGKSKRRLRKIAEAIESTRSGGG